VSARCVDQFGHARGVWLLRRAQARARTSHLIPA
jgi:hypothetical protein